MKNAEGRRQKAESRLASSESGSAVLIVFVVVGIMLILTLGNTRTVSALDKELRLIEQRQTNRWVNVATNQMPRVAVPVVPALQP